MTEELDDSLNHRRRRSLVPSYRPRRSAIAAVAIIASASAIALAGCNVQSCSHNLWTKTSAVYSFGPAHLTEASTTENATFQTQGDGNCYGLTATDIHSYSGSPQDCYWNPAGPNSLKNTSCFSTDRNDLGPKSVLAWRHGGYSHNNGSYSLLSRVGYTNGSSTFNQACNVAGNLASHQQLTCSYGGQ